MRCILNPDIALRAWRLVPCAYYRQKNIYAVGLKKEEFELLTLCDGQHDIPESDTLTALLSRGLCKAATEGDALTAWQKPRYCDNRYFPTLSWMITGKCNYNCLHCFNAADNAPLMHEFTYDEAMRLIDEAEACGINAFTLTGGEPMLHPHFFDIAAEIHRRGMFVDEINTNGHFITDETLDRLSAAGCTALIKISFDGIGHHDWLRNREGAEESALRAIRLCISRGFRVKVQTNVHRKNIHTILPTAELMDSLGVCEMRVIRTSESPRWLENGRGTCLEVAEYFDSMIEFAKAYCEKPHQMEIDIWQFLTLFPEHKTYRFRAVECGEGEYRASMPVCRGNRGKIAVAADGNVFPCHQLSGNYEARGDLLGNVKTDGLQQILQHSRYLSEVCTTVGTLAEKNKKCGSCPYFEQCMGGCRALAIALTGDKLGSDLSKCLFFKSGYPEKIERALPEWHNLLPISESIKARAANHGS